MVHILAWYFLKCLIYLACLYQTAYSLIDIFSVDVTESEHVIDDDEILIKLSDFLRRKLDHFLQSILIASNGIAELLHFIIQISQSTVHDKFVVVLNLINAFQQFDCFVFMNERSLLWCSCPVQLKCSFHCILKNSFKPKALLF